MDTNWAGGQNGWFTVYEITCDARSATSARGATSPSYRYYVGITSGTIENRYRQHEHGPAAGGAEWTRLHPPISFAEVSKHRDKQAALGAEMMHTLSLMARRGIDNVRGGPWVQAALSEGDRKAISLMITHMGDACHICRSTGHFAAHCPNRAADRGQRTTPSRPPAQGQRHAQVDPAPHAPPYSAFLSSLDESPRRSSAQAHFGRGNNADRYHDGTGLASSWSASSAPWPSNAAPSRSPASAAATGPGPAAAGASAFTSGRAGDTIAHRGSRAQDVCLACGERGHAVLECPVYGERMQEAVLTAGRHIVNVATDAPEAAVAVGVGVALAAGAAAALGFDKSAKTLGIALGGVAISALAALSHDHAAARGSAPGSALTGGAAPAGTGVGYASGATRRMRPGFT